MTTATETKRAKRMEQIRALLAKAQATNFPEEAQTFREKADQLMNMYAIETWQISATDPIDRPKPEMRLVDMSWWTTANAFYQDLWWLMQSTAKHCRCVAIYWEWAPGQMKVAGLPADLDYFDLLFTQLMLEHAKRLSPKPDPNGELGAEVFKLRQAGTDWKQITRMIWEAGMVELTPTERMIQERAWNTADATVDHPAWSALFEETRVSIKNRLANANRRYIKANGLQHERNYIHPKVYQRSFSEGFVGQITRRMEIMRGDSEANRPGDNEMALVLRDIRQVVAQWVDENYPKPEVKEEDDKKKKSKAVAKEVAFSWAAYNAGSAAGREVDIAANPGRGIGNRREIER